MVPAPVGFQCPECVGRARPPQPKTVAGATITARPVVTYILIAITVAVFALQLLVGMDESTTQWGMWPARVALTDSWWLLLTSAFLHGSFLHIAFNMYVLFALGPALERVLGHGRYLALHLLSALGGAVASFWFSEANAVSVGASGAIFGLMGALVVAGRRLRFDVRQVLILIAINLVIGFIAPGVDWRAHLGGLVTGAAVAAVFVFAPRMHRLMWQLLGTGAILLALVLLFTMRVMQLSEYLAPLRPVLNT